MTEQQLANMLQLSAVAIAWTLIICKALPAYLLDGFRQKMFAVRDELFDFAADGNVAFDHPAYTLLRRQMNGFIRYGHQLTVFRGLMTAVIHKIYGRRMESTWWDEWQQALESLNNPATREALEGFHRRAMMLAMKRLLYGSPLLWTMTLIFLV